LHTTKGTISDTSQFSCTYLPDQQHWTVQRENRRRTPGQAGFELLQFTQSKETPKRPILVMENGYLPTASGQSQVSHFDLPFSVKYRNYRRHGEQRA